MKGPATMRRVFPFGLALLLVIGAASSADALSFTLASYTVQSYGPPAMPDSNGGLEVDTLGTATLPLTTPDLNVGESFTFDLFQVSTPETWVNDDDLIPQAIDASFVFSSPSATAGPLSGTTVGAIFNFFIIPIPYAAVNWGGPLTFTFDNGGIFTLALSDSLFLMDNLWNGNVAATLTYAQASGQPLTVPEPATLFLFGTAVAGLAARARRRR
jgi:hypothetical protein